MSFGVDEQYDEWPARKKQDYLWQQIVNSTYTTLPTYKTFGGSAIKDLLGYLPSQILGAFNRNSDVLVYGRQKIIHKLGSTAKIQFVPNPIAAKDLSIQPFNGLIRLSNAVDAEDGIIYPSFAIKIMRDGLAESINIIVGKSFDAQRIGNNPDGSPDFNFFRDDPIFPFSNEIPTTPHSTLGKVFKGVFDISHPESHYIPALDLKSLIYGSAAAPRRLVFVAPERIQKLMPSNKHTDVRVAASKIQDGEILFKVYSSTGLNDRGQWIGDIHTASPFIASEFGDKKLYFRHER